MEAIRHGPGEIVNPSVSPTLAFGPEEKPKGGTSTVQATLLHSNTHGDREDGLNGHPSGWTTVCQGQGKYGPNTPVMAIYTNNSNNKQYREQYCV